MTPLYQDKKCSQPWYRSNDSLTRWFKLLSKDSQNLLQHSQRSFKTKKQVVSFSFRVGSEKFIGSYQRLRGSNYPDWITCMVMPESDVLGSVQRNNLINLIIGLTAFVITSLMCIFLSTRISSPLHTVAIENERIGTFDLTAKSVGLCRI